jgi:hypothetical protein
LEVHLSSRNQDANNPLPRSFTFVSKRSNFLTEDLASASFLIGPMHLSYKPISPPWRFPLATVVISHERHLFQDGCGILTVSGALRHLATLDRDSVVDFLDWMIQNIDCLTHDHIPEPSLLYLFSLCDESQPADAILHSGRVISLLVRLSDSLEPFANIPLLILVFTSLHTLSQPLLFSDFLYIVAAHLQCQNFKVASAWQEAFPISFFLSLRPSFGFICKKGELTPAQLFRCWLLCLWRLTQLSHTAAEVAELTRVLGDLMDDIQLDVEASITFLWIFYEMVIRRTLNIADFNRAGLPAMVLMMSMYREFPDLVQVALMLMGALIEHREFRIPTDLGHFLKIARESHGQHDGLCEQALHNASIFLRHDHELARNLPLNFVDELLAWLESASFTEKKMIAGFLSDYIAAACACQIAVDAGILKLLCELLESAESEFAILKALVSFVAFLATRSGDEAVFEFLGALDASSGLLASLTELAEAEDADVAQLAQALLEYAEPLGEEPES